MMKLLFMNPLGKISGISMECWTTSPSGKKDQVASNGKHSLVPGYVMPLAVLKYLT